jgi:hypothetical protein
MSLAVACERDFQKLYAEETASETLWGRESDACQECANTSCQTEAVACADDPTCSAQVACLQDCQDASCAAKCLDEGPTPALSCWREACFQPCWVERAWLTPTEELLGERMSPACGACFDAACGEAVQSCATGTSCVDQLGCYATCSDPPCVHRCLGRTTGDAALECLRTQCSEPCATGQRFACLGDYKEPRDAAKQALLSVTFADFFENTPPGELTVRLCAEPAVDCPVGVDEQMADAQGRVSFMVSPMAGAGYAAYLRAEGPSVTTSRYYFEFPIGRDWSMTQPTTNAATAKIIYELLDVTPVEGRGVIIAVMRDCQDDSAPFLRMNVVEGDADTRVVYQRGSELSLDFEETDSGGRVLIANVPTGGVTLQGFANDGKDLVIERKVGVESGAITWVSITPIPAR